MKKEYIKPIAREEVFLANNYVAACDLNISSTSTHNRMRCIIPWHDNYNEYFTSVWLDATSSNCAIKVTKDTTKTATNGNAFRPKEGALVYAADGTAHECDTLYTSTGGMQRPGQTASGYYLPWASGESCPCVGSYVYEGTYDEVSSKVFS